MIQDTYVDVNLVNDAAGPFFSAAGVKNQLTLALPLLETGLG